MQKVYFKLLNYKIFRLISSGINNPKDLLNLFFILVHNNISGIFFNKKFIHKYRKFFENKKGIEIGGPSKIFEENNLFPVYNLCESIDNVNFNPNTLWEKNLIDEGNFKIPNKDNKGIQFILDANNLSKLDKESYDFLISSHFLEHSANPIKCLKEFYRILKKEGIILIIVPFKEFTFDKRREFTIYEHILEDFTKYTKENDLTHLNEILEKHGILPNFKMDTNSEFIEKVYNNEFTRAMHHHVFNEDVLRKIIKYSGFKIIQSGLTSPYHLTCIAQKYQK